MEKLDLTKKYKTYYTAKAKPELTEIEPAQFISITGKGDPSEKPFAEKIEALYSVAYTIKFACKAQGNDFTVSKLEGLWWFDENKYTGMTIVNSPTSVPRSEWEYRLMIRMPDFVSESDINNAKKAVKEKKKVTNAGAVEYFTLNEGKCIQMLHVGPYSEEPVSLALIGRFSDEHNLMRNGLHHEIYLSDFRKTEPAKLKTILREPVK
jgi:hypothetical protein